MQNWGVSTSVLLLKDQGRAFLDSSFWRLLAMLGLPWLRATILPISTSLFTWPSSLGVDLCVSKSPSPDTRFRILGTGFRVCLNRVWLLLDMILYVKALLPKKSHSQVLKVRTSTNLFGSVIQYTVSLNFSFFFYKTNIMIPTLKNREGYYEQ